MQGPHIKLLPLFLQEALEQIDLLTEERDKLKDRYEDSKVYIGQLKDKI